ncbi:hypothetical protein SVAN01_06332 [Stagonosporopsis vannaccii]|nr:hypothetical protein SVAN01_06332 [Stagonosporopsis vannaccii]
MLRTQNALPTRVSSSSMLPEQLSHQSNRIPTPPTHPPALLLPASQPVRPCIQSPRRATRTSTPPTLQPAMSSHLISSHVVSCHVVSWHHLALWRSQRSSSPGVTCPTRDARSQLITPIVITRGRMGDESEVARGCSTGRDAVGERASDCSCGSAHGQGDGRAGQRRCSSAVVAVAVAVAIAVHHELTALDLESCSRS